MAERIASDGPAKILRRALDRRTSSPRPCPTTAFRVLNGPGDGGPPGVTVDLYDRWAVLSVREHVETSVRSAWTEALLEVLEPLGVVAKVWAPRIAESRSSVVHGEVPEALEIEEAGVRLECHLNDGMQTGVFLDHRETRVRAAELSPGAEVLNLFAYTCAFSVHAALGGAKRVTSVDVAKPALAWGRRNMSLNGVDPNHHRWFADDVLLHLRKPRRAYDLVIADPPVFGHGKRPFSLKERLDELLEGCVGQVADEGTLIFSTHHLSVGIEELGDRLSAAALRDRARLESVTVTGLPEWDHPTREAERDRGEYLSVISARVLR